jgi:hypothetical protein
MSLRRLAGFMICSALLGWISVGCESTEDTTTSTGTNDVTGTWTYSNTDGEQSTWALLLDGTTVSGAGTGGESISGTVSDYSIYLTLSYSTGDSASLNGTIADDTMTGSYTNTWNSSGSWTAVKTN